MLIFCGSEFGLLVLDGLEVVDVLLILDIKFLIVLYKILREK